MYAARTSRLTSLVKWGVRDGAWVGPRREGMRTFATLGGMYAAVAEQIFGDLTAAGKVMGLAPFGTPRFPVDEFLSVRDGRLVHARSVLLPRIAMSARSTTRLLSPPSGRHTMDNKFASRRQTRSHRRGETDPSRVVERRGAGSIQRAGM